MRNRKKSLQLKLLSLSALLIGLIAVSGGVSLMALGAVKDKGATMYSDRVVPLTQIGEVRGLLGDIDSQIQRAITSGKPTVEFSDITTADTKKIEELVTSYKSTVLVPAEERDLAAWDKEWSAYIKSFESLLAAASRGDLDEATRIYFASSADLYAKVDGRMVVLADTNDRVAKAVNADIVSTYSSSRNRLLALLGLSVLIGAGASFLLARSSDRGVRQVLVAPAASRAATSTSRSTSAAVTRSARWATPSGT
jgi:methyl-accepting chemotaxis protein